MSDPRRPDLDACPPEWVLSVYVDRECEPEDLPAIRLRLRDTLVDLDEPITVVANGLQVFEGVVPRTRAAIDRSLAERLDHRSAATAEQVVRLVWPDPDAAAPPDP